MCSNAESLDGDSDEVNATTRNNYCHVCDKLEEAEQARTAALADAEQARLSALAEAESEYTSACDAAYSTQRAIVSMVILRCIMYKRLMYVDTSLRIKASRLSPPSR